jgi:hypothetical protein
MLPIHHRGEGRECQTLMNADGLDRRKMALSPALFPAEPTHDQPR